MNQILEIGKEIKPGQGREVIRVERFLGGGGQGEVYRVVSEGNLLALKWYYPEAINSAYMNNLKRLIDKGRPNENYLWPMELIEDPNIESFGYLMPLRDERYHGIVDLMKRRIEPSFRTLALAGFKLAHSFLQLHSKGMCYSDISFGNIFLHPDCGDILICDNDNCIFDGEKAPIKGTPRFMAPEVVKGQNPNIQSDLFSLAVLLFYMFYLHHPLEGAKEAAIKCFDLPAMKKLYGTEPVYIFDPANDSNRPVPGLHDNAIIFNSLYPKFFRDYFTRAFTAGIEDHINGRIRETEWRSAMLRLHDSIIYCPSCGAENFFDQNLAADDKSQSLGCWSCSQKVPLPPVLKVNRHRIMLNYDAKLYPHHVDNSADFDFTNPIAIINRHPERPEVWGLKNLSENKWVSFSALGQAQDVEPGRSVTLAMNTRINFGKSEGIIET